MPASCIAALCDSKALLGISSDPWRIISSFLVFFPSAGESLPAPLGALAFVSGGAASGTAGSFGLATGGFGLSATGLGRRGRWSPGARLFTDGVVGPMEFRRRRERCRELRADVGRDGVPVMDADLRRPPPSLAVLGLEVDAKAATRPAQSAARASLRRSLSPEPLARTTTWAARPSRQPPAPRSR
eukprot:scaffold1026_cov272-Pinguiococcus_pyrenoidosus.AAC.15